MDTMVKVLPARNLTTSAGETTQQPLAAQIGMDLDGQTRIEPNIHTFLGTQSLLEDTHFRLLPNRTNEFYVPAENPFSRDNQLFSLLSSLPLIFVLDKGTKPFNISPPLNLATGCWNSFPRYCVSVGFEPAAVEALLVRVPIRAHLPSAAHNAPAFRAFLGTLGDLLKKNDDFVGLPHCWLAPSLREALSHPSDLSCLPVNPIPLSQLRLTNKLLVRCLNCPIRSFKMALARLLAASKEMYFPWLLPAGKELFLRLNGQFSAKISCPEPNPPGTVGYFWPLSPLLELDFVCETADEPAVGTVDHPLPLVSLPSLGAVPPQGELLPRLAHSIRASIQRSAIARCHGRSPPMCGHILLSGYIGSGKSTLLKALATHLEHGVGHELFIGAKLVDFATLPQSSHRRMVEMLENALADLTVKWPCALLIDNFDFLIRGIAVVDGGDANYQQVEIRRLYQSIFKSIQTARKIPVLCTISEWTTVQKDMFVLDGQPFFQEEYKIRELDKAEQFALLGALAGQPIDQQQGSQLSSPFSTIGDFLSVTARKALGHDPSNQMSWQVRNKQPAFGQDQMDIRFNQVAGLSEAKQRLTEAFIWPRKYPELFGARGSGRAILHGPSGCGKSLLMRALAGEMGLNVMAVRGPELLSKYIGQSEQNVRHVFAKARSSRPALIAFDEIDALAPHRGADNSQVTDRVVNQLLTELDGFEADTDGVFVIAATNRLEMVDKALLRPGRLDHKVFVGKPNMEDRLALLQMYTSSEWGVELSDNNNLGLIAQQTDGLSGAEVKAIVQRALHSSQQQDKSVRKKGPKLRQSHLQSAVDFMVNRAGRKGDSSAADTDIGDDSSLVGQRLIFS